MGGVGLATKNIWPSEEGINDKSVNFASKAEEEGEASTFLISLRESARG